MITEPKWYALYTKPRWEKKVANLLGRKEIEHYCPLNKVQRQWSDRMKTVEEPLFTGYVFVRIKEVDFIKVKQTDGVITVLQWLGKPAIIKDHEIDAIKSFLKDHTSVQVLQTDVVVNDVVKITQGPLVYKEGNVVEITNHFVKVVLPSLQCALIARVHKSHIEKVNTIANRQASA
jgi:transcription antitermination factor NusG